MYFGCSEWGYLWEKEDAASAGSPLWHQAAALDQVMGFIFFPLFQEKKIHQNQSCLWETAPKHFLTREKVHWKKKKFPVFLDRRQRLWRGNSILWWEVNRREKVEMQRKVSNVPRTTFPGQAEAKFPSLPQLSSLQLSLGKEMFGNLSAPCRQERPRFLCAMPRAAGQQEHSGEAGCPPQLCSWHQEFSAGRGGQLPAGNRSWGVINITGFAK